MEKFSRIIITVLLIVFDVFYSYGKSWKELDTWNKLLRDFELEDSTKYSYGHILVHIDVDSPYGWETLQSVRDSIDAEWARKRELTDFYSIEKQKIVALKNERNVWVMTSNDLSAYNSLLCKSIETNEFIWDDMRRVLDNYRDSIYLYEDKIYLITADRSKYRAELQKIYNRPAYKFLRDSVYGVKNSPSEIPISEVANFFSNCVENYSDSTAYSLSLQKLGSVPTDEIEVYIIRPDVEKINSSFENNFYMLIKRGNRYFLSPIWESFSWDNLISRIPNISGELTRLIMDYGDFQWVNMGAYFITGSLYKRLSELSIRITES
ncbi:MAG: hypothetical protein K2I64_00600 [Muribaculaceae bacterium]|nr:hypothetical protein [Muribaculaceae bacterium]